MTATAATVAAQEALPPEYMAEQLMEMEPETAHIAAAFKQQVKCRALQQLDSCSTSDNAVDHNFGDCSTSGGAFNIGSITMACAPFRFLTCNATTQAHGNYHKLSLQLPSGDLLHQAANGQPALPADGLLH